LRQLDALFGSYRLTALQYDALCLIRETHPEQLPTLVLRGGSLRPGTSERTCDPV
jgi:hypothetical protein